MQLGKCDCCKGEVPALGPDSAGNWVADKGADGWTRLQFVIYREAAPPAYVELHPGQAFYQQVTSKAEICWPCLQALLAAFSLERRIATDVSQKGDFVTLPRAALEALQAAALKVEGQDG